MDHDKLEVIFTNAIYYEESIHSLLTEALGISMFGDAFKMLKIPSY